jgi:hypothetical protein
VSTLKVNCVRLIIPGQAFWDASRERSRSTARWRIRSVDAFRLKSGVLRDSIELSDVVRVEGGRSSRQEYIPALPFIKFVDGTIGWRILARTVLGAHARVGLGVCVRVGVSDTMNLGGAEGEASLTMRHIVYCSIPPHPSCISPPPGFTIRGGANKDDVVGTVPLSISTDSRVLRNKSPHSSSKRARVRTDMKLMPLQRESISVVVCVAEERVRLAHSQGICKQRRARGLME